jgi:hypothetical protein
MTPESLHIRGNVVVYRAKLTLFAQFDEHVSRSSSRQQMAADFLKWLERDRMRRVLVLFSRTAK